MLIFSELLHKTIAAVSPINNNNTTIIISIKRQAHQHRPLQKPYDQLHPHRSLFLMIGMASTTSWWSLKQMTVIQILRFPTKMAQSQSPWIPKTCNMSPSVHPSIDGHRKTIRLALHPWCAGFQASFLSLSSMMYRRTQHDTRQDNEEDWRLVDSDSGALTATLIVTQSQTWWTSRSNNSDCLFTSSKRRRLPIFWEDEGHFMAGNQFVLLWRNIDAGFS